MVQIKNWRNHASIALDDATRQDAQITQIFWSHPPPIPADTHALTFLCSFFLKKPWEKHSGLGTAPTTSYFDPKHWCNFHNPQSNLWNIDYMWPLSLSLYIILYYFILFYIMLYDVVLYCIVLYCIIFHRLPPPPPVWPPQILVAYQASPRILGPECEH